MAYSVYYGSSTSLPTVIMLRCLHIPTPIAVSGRYFANLTRILVDGTFGTVMVLLKSTFSFGCYLLLLALHYLKHAVLLYCLVCLDTDSF